MADAAVLDAPQTAPDAEPAAPAAGPAVTWAPDPRLAPPADAPSGEAPTTDGPAAAAPGEGESPKGPESKPAAPPAAESIPVDWKAKLEVGDPEFLKDFENHPKVKGFIAGRAAFLAQQEREAQAKAARDAELDRDAEENPDRPLAQERLAQRQNEHKMADEAVARVAAFDAVKQGVGAFVQSLPDDARAEIAKLAPEGKPYGEPGDLTSALNAYMADVVAGAVTAQRAAWEKEVLPGLRKEVQAELLGREPSPDLGVGAITAGGAGGLTAEKYAQMSPAEARALLSTSAGKAQVDALWATALKPPRG